MRLIQHQESSNNTKTFTGRYNIEFLIYYEKFIWIQKAISREKELKKWRRDKKIELIKVFNPTFEFLDL